MRSCYPELVLRSKKLNAVHLAEDPNAEPEVEVPEEPEETDHDDFHDVEAVLSEHVPQASSLPATAFHETEAAEV